MATLALIAAALFSSQETDRYTEAREKLVRLIADARQQKEDARRAKKKSEANLAQARELMKLAEANPEAEESQAILKQLGPKLVEDARCLIQRAVDTGAAADTRLRLTQKALENLQAPPPGVTDRLLRRVGDRYSRECDREVARSNGFVSHPAAERRLSGAVDRLLPFAPYSDERPRLRIVKGSFGRLRAFATSDTIYVMENCLKGASTEAELLRVVAHELAHAQMGHYQKFIVHRIAQEKLQQLEGPGAKDEANAERIFEDALAARTGAYSVEQEMEAEVLGAQMAIAAGVPPNEILKMIAAEQKSHDRAEKRLSEPDRRLHRLMDDHPRPGDVLKKLKDMLETP